jgi:hypothetical protein
MLETLPEVLHAVLCSFSYLLVRNVLNIFSYEKFSNVSYREKKTHFMSIFFHNPYGI